MKENKKQQGAKVLKLVEQQTHHRPPWNAGDLQETPRPSEAVGGPVGRNMSKRPSCNLKYSVKRPEAPDNWPEDACIFFLPIDWIYIYIYISIDWTFETKYCNTFSTLCCWSCITLSSLAKKLWFTLWLTAGLKIQNLQNWMTWWCRTKIYQGADTVQSFFTLPAVKSALCWCFQAC